MISCVLRPSVADKIDENQVERKCLLLKTRVEEQIQTLEFRLHKALLIC